MLKAQIKSKLSGVSSTWQAIEDILTGDFFGTLDYLPRDPFLHNFIAHVASLNPHVQTPIMEGVNWHNLRLTFWPRTHTDDENAEPDVVISSDRWILVVEVKLDSGFGDSQPWREYVVGQKIAEAGGIPRDSVYYLVVARNHLDISSTFKPVDVNRLKELQAKTSYLRWHEAASLTKSWLRDGCAGKSVSPEQTRMLNDLLLTMRRRRAIAFSGFAFADTSAVGRVSGGLFCPPLFAGFFCQIPKTKPVATSVFLDKRYSAFAAHCPKVLVPGNHVFLDNGFDGFAHSTPKVLPACDGVFLSPAFKGFLDVQLACQRFDKVFLKETGS